MEGFIAGFKTFWAGVGVGVICGFLFGFFKTQIVSVIYSVIAKIKGLFKK